MHVKSAVFNGEYSNEMLTGHRATLASQVRRPAQVSLHLVSRLVPGRNRDRRRIGHIERGWTSACRHVIGVHMAAAWVTHSTWLPRSRKRRNDSAMCVIVASVIRDDKPCDNTRRSGGQPAERAQDGMIKVVAASMSAAGFRVRLDSEFESVQFDRQRPTCQFAPAH